MNNNVGSNIVGIIPKKKCRVVSTAYLVTSEVRARGVRGFAR
jgi:hypothetical protein